ncbi:hypothetical protein U9M48_014481 [Paspalum notatum var. saurae]|uniref:Hexosyltransferase n=1 Tax=Paspalum notatum var. saurae TaxID=547442 RepID=A0AAQ3T355_PASNO
MKADDDTYLRVAVLVEELRTKPRVDVYFGRSRLPRLFPDIIPRHLNDTHGHEDRLVGKWLNVGGRGKNRHNLKPRMYDVHWDVDNIWPDTVAVHRLKDNRRWAAAFRYFNVTAGVTPSNMDRRP